MNKKVFIIHGWGGSPSRDWMSWAKKALIEKRYEVIVPAMPDSENPRVESWVPYLATVIGEVRETDMLVGHSVGCQTILRFLEKLPEGQKVDKVIMVAGFTILKNLTEEEVSIAKPWVETPIDFEKVKNHANSFTAIFSDDDPVVPLEANRKVFKEKLGAKIIIQKQQGHFNNQTLPVLLNLI